MKRALLLVARLALGATFAVAGVLKLRDPAAFAQDIVNYQLVPALAPIMAVVLPALEVVLGVVLIAFSSPWRRAAALVSGGLMAVFILAASTALARGLDVSCGCFGGGSGAITWTTLLRDLALLAAAALVLFLDRARSAPRLA
jgi:putative oxidoreductase